MSDDLQDVTARVIASLRSALASGSGVRDALRDGFARNAAFFTIACAGVLSHALGPAPDPAKITEFAAGLRGGPPWDESPGFEQCEAEALIRGMYGDLSAGESISWQAVSNPALPVALMDAAFARWRPTPSELDELFAAAAEAEREMQIIVPPNLWAAPEDPARAREEALARSRPTAADAEPLILRGRMYGSHSLPVEALADYDSAIILDPGNVAALTERGLLRDKLGQHTEALADLDRAISLDPANVFALKQRGHIRFGLSRRSEALADFDRVISLDPSYAGGYVGRGIVRTDEEHYELALADFDRAVELQPDNPGALGGRADALRLLGRYPEAMSDAGRCVEIDPTADAYMSRAHIYREMERYEDALADYCRAIEVDPAGSWRLVMRGAMYQALGRYADALADFDRAIELNPGEAWILVGRGMLFEDMGRETDAKADYARAIELEPSYADALTD